MVGRGRRKRVGGQWEVTWYVVWGANKVDRLFQAAWHVGGVTNEVCRWWGVTWYVVWVANKVDGGRHK